MKTLIVLSAPPASGKSTWARNYRDNHDNVFIVSSDEVRFDLTGQYQDFSKQADVWVEFDKRITELGNREEDLTVIADSLCDTNELRRGMIEKHPEFNRFLLVVFTCKYEEALVNNVSRDSQLYVPEDVMAKLWGKFEKPSVETTELFDDYIRIIGNFKRK